MLQTVDVGAQSIDRYQSSAGPEALEQLRALAAPLRGAHVLHLNTRPYGGGVAEILRSEVPLLRDLGIAADWKLITGDAAFFSVTKAIHNGLQGAERDLTSAEQETYLASSTRNARLLDEQYDLIVVHDPQPLAILQLHGNGSTRWIWRCHIDTSEQRRPSGVSCARSRLATTRRSSLWGASSHPTCRSPASRSSRPPLTRRGRKTSSSTLTSRATSCNGSVSIWTVRS